LLEFIFGFEKETFCGVLTDFDGFCDESDVEISPFLALNGLMGF